MALTIKNFTTLVQDFAAAVQARSSRLIDFSVGSVLRAVSEASAAVVLWLESSVVYVLTLTRASTSKGADLDSWMADYGMSRLGAQAAAGQVTFGRYTTTAQGLVPVGAQVQTADRSQRFTVVTDTANSAYSATLGGYVIAAGVTSIAVPVECTATGTAGNVSAGTVTVIYGAMTGIDYVTNVGAMTGGYDAESDESFLARFQLRIAGTGGVRESVADAIASLRIAIQYVIVENRTLAGASKDGFFFVVVDDGTGSPPQSLIDDVSTAVDRVRPLGIQFAVYAPSVVTVAVSMTLTVASTYSAATVRTAVSNAIKQHIDTLPLGSPLYYTRLSQIAYDTSPGVTNVSAVLVNGGTADVAAGTSGVIKYSTVAIG